MNLSGSDASLNLRPSNSSSPAASMALRVVVMFALAFALMHFAAQTARAQSYSVLYAFCAQPNCADGATPNPNLVVDSKGNVYGTTQTGGPDLDGAVFEISPTGVEKLMHGFNSIPNGYLPKGSVIQDGSGNFYGT